jgi:hypothetical protein
VDACQAIKVRHNPAIADRMIFASLNGERLRVRDHWQQLLIAFLWDRGNPLLFKLFLKSTFALLPFLKLFPKF